MRKEILLKKQRLLQRISKKRYGELIKFVEKVYLADFDLKILMARKFSNLYFTLLPFVKEEHGGRTEQLYHGKFMDKREPVVVSNRALDALKEEIQSGKYKKILLADDIIIHGRTLEGIYKLIESWFWEKEITDYEIKVYAYAESVEGILEDMEFMQNREVEKRCTTDQWRAISNDIVHVFYSLGMPYTSYVPNGSIRADSLAGKCLETMLENEDQGFYCQTSVDMEMHSARSYVCVEPDSMRCALNCSMRIYRYDDTGEFICAPMVMMKPISLTVLWECLTVLQDIIHPNFWIILKQRQQSDMVYRAFVYIVSALWGWRFIGKTLGQKPAELIYEKQEEIINFNSEIIDWNKINLENSEWIMDKLQAVCEKYEPVADIDDLITSESDYKALDQELNNVITMFNEIPNSSIREIMGKYLNSNGVLDEKRCKNQKSENKEKRRLIGYPLVKLRDKLKGYGAQWIRAVLYAIDYGKGSIVSKTVVRNGKRYFLSVIHAGEQNYKYFEETYFPFLYGLYNIERAAQESGCAEKTMEWKDAFLKEYGEYWTDKRKSILQDDLEQMRQMNVSAEFREVIINAAWNYFGEPDFEKALEIAEKYCR